MSGCAWVHGCVGAWAYAYMYTSMYTYIGHVLIFIKHCTAQIETISPCNTRQTVFRGFRSLEAKIAGGCLDIGKHPALCNDDSGKQLVQLFVISDDQPNAIVVDYLLYVVVICMLAKSRISALTVTD